MTPRYWRDIPIVAVDEAVERIHASRLNRFEREQDRLQALEDEREDYPEVEEWAA